MAVATFTFKLDDKKFQAALKDPKLVKGPVRKFLERSAKTVEGAAKEKVTVDTGRLRSSIASEVRTSSAVIGTNLTYAPFVEFGTRPHFPPVGALRGWARRHGFPARGGAFLVARAISRRGTKAKPFLVPSLEQSKPKIKRFFRVMGEEIGKRWRQPK